MPPTSRTAAADPPSRPHPTRALRPPAQPAAPAAAAATEQPDSSPHPRRADTTSDNTMRTHYCGQVTAADLDQIVTLCGWVHRRRDHGGVIFIDLRDREGLVQVVCDP